MKRSCTDRESSQDATASRVSCKVRSLRASGEAKIGNLQLWSDDTEFELFIIYGIRLSKATH
jgi:hypothetical protein